MIRRRTLRAEILESRRVLTGPYAPAVGQPGTTAIVYDAPAFVGWATGWSDFAPGSNVDESWKMPEKALGPAVPSSFDIVALGDNGEITLTFDRPIQNGAGWDFAVFENSISDTFLELGYVEVSSDGVNFFRFSNDSRTPSPVGAFGAVDPTNINGYGGKYRQGYGTPFDLNELAGVSSLLDVNRITHVKIVDIVGDGSALDSNGDVIYDSYPTTGSGGFDLDAVGVIHQVEYAGSFAGFEDVGATLSDESAWFGPDPTGEEKMGAYGDTVVEGHFDSEGLRLNNIYSLDYEVWTGWGYSNATDTTTPGFMNQMSAFPGGGAGGSPTYAVASQDAIDSYPLPRIDLAEAGSGKFFASLMVANTTYAALSMLHGDSFAKKFGGPSGDDPDWLLLTIYGKDANDNTLGSIDYYLADYRFSDNSEDYIRDDWSRVDLASLRGATSLEFRVTSSDVGPFGMNTPAFFAIDQVEVAQEQVRLEIAADSISEGAGAAATMGVVGRNDDDLGQPLVVHLSSSDSSEATVPATVTIPAGEASASFPIDAVNDVLVDGTQTVTIFASAAGYAQNSASLDVTDDDTPGLTLTLNVSTVSEGAGAGAATATLTRNTPTAAPLLVTLLSSDTTAATAPATVTIPVGQASVQFPLNAVNDQVVDGLQTTTITASASGFADGVAALDVTDDDARRLTVTVEPTTISESEAPPTALFEEVGATLAPESFWNGSDGSGGFQTGGLAFNNGYNFDFGVWDGWSFSNTTDAITPGFFNQYSAYAGSGANDSSTYGVAFVGGQTPTIALTEANAGLAFQSLRVTNTTYAALAMLQGDAFAKKFGGESGDDSDWFLLTIEGRDENGVAVGQVEFYLADYRFSDPEHDYIVQDWTEVDVSSLSGAVELAFSLSSSDVGVFGMNTPGYVAVDAIVLSDGSPAAAMGTVTRNDADLSQLLTVQLASSDESEAAVPTIVIIPAGEASAQFPIAALRDAIADGSQVVTITANATNYAPGFDIVTVSDEDSAQLTLTIAAESVSEGAGAGATTAVIHRNTATTNPLNVTLFSNDVGEVSAPISVVIPAGQASVQFLLDAVDDGLVDGLQSATITAVAAGFADGVDTLDVTDDDIPTLTLTLSTSATLEGTAITGTVTRNTSTTTELLVSLSINDATSVTGPSAVTIPAGQSSIEFALEALDDMVVNGSRTVEIIASVAGFAPGDAALDVLDDDVPTLTVTLANPIISEGAGVGAVVATVTRNSETSTELLVHLSSSDPSAAQVPASVTIPAGQASVQFLLDVVDDELVDGVQIAVISAMADGFSEGSNSLDVHDDDTPRLTIILAAASVFEDAGAAATTGAVRRNTATTEALSVTLSTSNPTAVQLPATVTIPAGAAFVEFAIDAVDDDLAEDVQTATLTAAAAGFENGDATIEVVDDDAPQLTLTLSTSAAFEGAVITGHVTRNSNPSEPLTVLLFSSDLSEATVPDTVTIPAGQVSTEFSIHLTTDGVIDGAQSATLTAQAPDHNDGTSVVEVLDNSSPWRNLEEPSDVDDNDLVTLEDLRQIVMVLRDYGNPYVLSLGETEGPPLPQFPDPTGDGIVSVADVLAVVQTLRIQIENSSEGEPEHGDERSEFLSPAPAWPQQVDLAFAATRLRDKRAPWRWRDDLWD